MSALEAYLKRQIAQSGPLTVAEYVTICLTHPEHGYYVTRDPLGAAGDFVTAPEISQMFGELVGLALAQAWMDQGAPNRFALIELGPGRGTLMADIWRATARVPGFQDAAEVHLVEASPALRDVQAETCAGMSPLWHDDLTDLPELPIFGVANEFFDALPIRQFLRKGDAWCERVISVVDDKLAFGMTPPAPLAALEKHLATTEDGDLVETSSLSETSTELVAAHIATLGGAFLVIDYGRGPGEPTGDTFQAVRAHAKVRPLENPGTADLTAHVDFEALADAAHRSGTVAHGPVGQGAWLEMLGITARAKTLAQNLEGVALNSHIEAHRRLTHPAEMGTLFKVLGITPKHVPAPPGLEPGLDNDS